MVTNFIPRRLGPFLLSGAGLCVLLGFVGPAFGAVPIDKKPPAPRSAKATTFAQGVALYNNYQYKQAIDAFEAVLKGGKASKEQTKKMYVLLALCHYKLAKPKQAKGWFVKALKIDPKASLPKPQSAPTLQHFEGIRRAFASAQRPRLRRRVVRRRPAPRPRRRPPAARRVVRKIAKVPKARPIPRRKRPAAPKPKKSFVQKHAASLVLLSAALLTGGASLGFGLLFQQQRASLQEKLKSPHLHSANTIAEAHSQASSTGLVTNILLISAGGLGAAGLSIFVIESFKKR